MFYLGFLIGARPRSSVLWNTVVENFERKMSPWKRGYLSLGWSYWSITLIKACLSNLSIYYMSMFKIIKCLRVWRLG